MIALRGVEIEYDEDGGGRPVRYYLIDPRLAQHYINIQDWHEWWNAAIDADMEDAWHA